MPFGVPRDKGIFGSARSWMYQTERFVAATKYPICPIFNRWLCRVSYLLSNAWQPLSFWRRTFDPRPYFAGRELRYALTRLAPSAFLCFNHIDPRLSAFARMQTELITSRQFTTLGRIGRSGHLLPLTLYIILNFAAIRQPAATSLLIRIFERSLTEEDCFDDLSPCKTCEDDWIYVV